MTKARTTVLLVGMYGASAAPISNESVSWQDEPSGRGTWSILSSCVLTLILCVYTAVHMNVPPAAEPRSKRLRHLTGWVLTGVFAPEIVAWTAWTQWSDAQSITTEIKKLQLQLNDKTRSALDRPDNIDDIAPLLENWTPKHSFFVIMGGFQFRPSSVVQQLDRQRTSEGFEYKMQPKCVLTSTGLLNLLHSGQGSVIPVLTVDDIEDRSKADALAKVLSCLQGFWLIFQIFARVIARLIVTELEINTLAHVICALTMYVLWMNKPLKVEQPVWVSTERLVSWTMFHSGLNKTQRKWLRRLAKRQDNPGNSTSPASAIHHHYDCSELVACEMCNLNNVDRGLKGLMLRSDVTMQREEIVSMLNNTPDGFSICDFVIDIDENFYDHSGLADMDHVVKGAFPVQVLRVNQNEVYLLLQILSLPDRRHLIENMTSSELNELERSSRMFKRSYMDKTMSVALMAFVSAMYGGLHAALWRHSFPTPAEKWLWRISSLCVAGNGLHLTLLGSLDWLRRRHQGLETPR